MVQLGLSILTAVWPLLVSIPVFQKSSSQRSNPAAFIFYDYIITLDQEVETFWKETCSKKRLSAAAILFLVNRYLVLLLRLVNMAGFAPISSHG